MHGVPTLAPTNVAALDARDRHAGGASHVYGVQHAGGVQVIRFQHGPRTEPGSTPGLFDDDLLAIVEDRLACFQAGPFACSENGAALAAVQAARQALGDRVAARMAQGVLGENEPHVTGKTPSTGIPVEPWMKGSMRAGDVGG